MADPTPEDLKRQFTTFTTVLHKLWTAWREIQKTTNNHRELSDQSINAALSMAATLAVDISVQPEIAKAKFDMLYKEAYDKAPKFG